MVSVMLNGKTALVTGGSSGIGLTAARLLRDNGARVAIMGSSQEKLDRAVADLGDDVVAIRGDVTLLGDARAGVTSSDHAAIVLDIGLPDGSGLDLLAEWRARGIATPILLLTARNLVSDRIDGLDGGADDYLGKPFDLAELSARLRVLLRRSNGRAHNEIVLGSLTIDEACREVRLDGQEITLSRREYAILHALVAHPGHILSRAQLEDRIYGWQEEVESNAVEVHIHKLRSKLGRNWIETVRGEGYRVARP